jgi:hypothetical protein
MDRHKKENCTEGRQVDSNNYPLQLCFHVKCTFFQIRDYSSLGGASQTSLAVFYLSTGGDGEGGEGEGASP